MGLLDMIFGCEPTNEDLELNCRDIVKKACELIMNNPQGLSVYENRESEYSRDEYKYRDKSISFVIKSSASLKKRGWHIDLGSVGIIDLQKHEVKFIRKTLRERMENITIDMSNHKYTYKPSNYSTSSSSGAPVTNPTTIVNNSGPDIVDIAVGTGLGMIGADIINDIIDD
jgi:hypothetical protein